MILSSTSTSTGLRPEYEYDQSQNASIQAVPGHDMLCKVEPPTELASNVRFWPFGFMGFPRTRTQRRGTRSIECILGNRLTSLDQPS